MILSKKLITVGVVTLVGGLLVTFPARVAYHWFAPADLQLSGLSGSVWNGNAIAGSVSGIYIRNLEWHFRPASLFTGKVAYATSSEPAGGFMDAVVAVGITGNVILDDIVGAISLSALPNSANLNGISGNVRLDFERLVLRDGAPTEAVGTVEVSGLIARGLSGSPIGDYQAEFLTNESGIVGSVEDLSGVLDVAGSIQVDVDRNYSFVGQVAAKGNAPRSITEQLRFLGSPNERGQREFRFEGQL